jgi:hypothetical protein
MPYTPLFYFEDEPRKAVFNRAIFWIFTLMPWNPLAKAILDMAAATNTGVHPGLRWAERDSYCIALAPGEAPPPHDPLETWVDTACVFPVGSCLSALAVQFVAYTLLAVYFDNVVPNALGVKRHPLFFLRRGFWAPQPVEQGAALARLVAEGEARLAERKACEKAGAPPPRLMPQPSVVAGVEEDEDVRAESTRAKQSLGQKLRGILRVEESEWLGLSLSLSRGRRASEAHRRSSAGGAGSMRRRSMSGGGVGGGSGADGSMGAAAAAALAAQQRQWQVGSGKGKDGAHAQYAVEVFGLQKVFRASWWARNAPGYLGGDPRARDFWAIKDSWFGIEQGSLFCLLGPNGAGKTTTINCLTGADGGRAGACFWGGACPPPLLDRTTHPLIVSSPWPPPSAAGALPPTAGDALIYGESLCGEGGLDRVRSLMGVCPQFDVLWNELSGTEHLTIYGHIKGLKFSEVR